MMSTVSSGYAAFDVTARAGRGRERRRRVDGAQGSAAREQRRRRARTARELGLAVSARRAEHDHADDAAGRKAGEALGDRLAIAAHDAEVRRKAGLAGLVGGPAALGPAAPRVVAGVGEGDDRRDQGETHHFSGAEYGRRTRRLK
jgi:hypothetical protein